MSKPLPQSYVKENVALARIIAADEEKYHGISQEWAKLILKKYEDRKGENERKERK